MSVEKRAPRLYFGVKTKKGEPLPVPNIDDVIIDGGIVRVTKNPDGSTVVTEHQIDVVNSGRGTAEKGGGRE